MNSFNQPYSTRPNSIFKQAGDLGTSVPGESVGDLAKRIKRKSIDMNRFFQNTDAMPSFKLPVPGFKQPQIRQMLDEFKKNPDHYLNETNRLPSFLLESAIRMNPDAWKGVNAAGTPGNITKTAASFLLNWGLPIAAGAVDLLDPVNNKINSLDADLARWSIGRDTDGLETLIKENNIGGLGWAAPAIGQLAKNDPAGFWDFVIRDAESRGVELYKPNSMIPHGANARAYALGQDPGIQRTLQDFQQGRYGEGFSRIKNFIGNNLNESAKIEGLYDKDTLGAAFNAVPGLWDSKVRQREGYRNPAEILKGFYKNQLTGHGKALKRDWNDATKLVEEWKAGDRRGALGRFAEKQISYLSGTMARATEPNRELLDSANRNLGFEALKQRAEANPEVPEGIFLGLANQYNTPGASDNLGYALLRKFTGRAVPQGYRSVREIGGDLKDATKVWAANAMTDPLTGIANAWNNPYGKAAILGTGTLAAAGLGIKAMMDKRKKEEEDKKLMMAGPTRRAPLQTRGIHRLGAY